VSKTAWQAGTQGVLASVAERRVPEVVPERDRLGQVLVQVQAPRDRPRDLHDLHGVGQPGPVMIAERGDEDLRLVLQPAERLGVDDAVTVDLERRPHLVIGLVLVALGLRRAGRELRERLLAFEQPLLHFGV
jgi:hypothetical protein